MVRSLWNLDATIHWEGTGTAIIPSLLTWVDVEREGTVCCLWCTSAPIESQ